MNLLSSSVHTVIGIIVGLALIFAPSLFGFADMGTPATVAFGVGIFILLSELTSTSPVSLLKLIPMPIHLMIDIATGLFLIASPWLIGFAQLPTNAWMPHVIAGFLAVGYALITNTASDRSKIAHA